MPDHLYLQLCNKESLYNAWQRVKEKNTAGGVDKQTVENYSENVDKNLDELLNLLSSGQYIQQPYREILIPKNENEKRRLGLLTVNDKIVQTAATQLLTPLVERRFLNVSYGYRSGRGAVKAIRRIKQLIRSEHYTWVSTCDIDNFFDTIPHDLLFRKLNNFLKCPDMTELIKMFVSMGSVTKSHHWKSTNMGIPQGSIISPLLANFYLHPLDQLMVDKKCGFIRYADDFIILSKSEVQAKSALKAAIDLILNQLKLSLNDNTETKPISEGFEFLGIYFINNQITLSEKKKNRLLSKLYSASRIGSQFITPKLIESLRGIKAFYGQLLPQKDLESLDDLLLDLFRQRINEINPDYKLKKQLIKELHTIDFLAHKHNYQRAAYVDTYFNVDDHAIQENIKSGVKSPVKTEKAVAKRKHEYQKIESDGFDLVLSTPGVFVGKREHALIVKRKTIILQEIPLINLKNITVISEGVNFSSNAIQACCENRVSIDFLKNNGLPYAIVMNPVYVDLTYGLCQLEAYTNNKGIELVKQFVRGKITNQINLLKYFGKYYRKQNDGYNAILKAHIPTLKCHANSAVALKGDDLDVFRLSMFGIEGQASARYWEALSLIINEKLVFEGRERQGAVDLVNCMLNYGYGILYARISEAIIKAGLNPCLSYLHKPEKNRPSLVYDLIEEFRQQAVDRVVVSIITKSKDLNAVGGQLDERTKKLLAQKVIERMNTVEIFRNKEMRLFEIIQHQAHAIVKYLTAENNTYKPYIRKW